MSVNSVGPNVGGSSLLASYLEKQNAAPAVQNPPVQSSAQSQLQTLPAQVPMVQAPAAQNAVAQTPAVPVAQAANNEIKPENKTKKPSFITRVKEFFKNPASKKIIIAGISAAVVIAGITTFALLSRRKPQVSEELESTLWNFVNTINGLIGSGK